MYGLLFIYFYKEGTMKSFELSSRKYKNGRRPFKAVLYELQPPECVVDDVGTKYNANGITFLEEYAKDKLDSIADMSVRAAFIDDDRTIVSDHGDTGIRDGLPVFENAVIIGHCTKGYIADIEMDGETKRCVCANGYIDEMCYPEFVAIIEDDLANDIDVGGSIEIYKSEGNDAIIYKKGYIPKGRIPTEYIHSGWDIVLNPADKASKLLELNNSHIKKEEKAMDFTMDDIKTVITNTMTELNNKDEAHTQAIQSLNDKISELNTQIENKDSVIAEKDAKISELNASVEQLQAALNQLKSDQDTYWSERAILEQELAKAKVAERLAELDTALSEFNDEEKAVANDDIVELQKKIEKCEKVEELESVTSEINSIKSKICMAIVEKQKAEAKEQARISEQNSRQGQVNLDDIFSDMYMESPVGDTQDEMDIF